jgi:acetyl esterase/lipase
MYPVDAAAAIPVWPESLPQSLGWSAPEQETFLPMPATVPQTLLPLPFNILVTRNVAQPTLTPFLPEPSIATGTAVVICPGGVFHFLADQHEGADVARWLAAAGVAAFVLKYRVLPTAKRDEDLVTQLQERFSDLMSLMPLMQEIEPLAVADGIQALRVVRHNAAAWGIAPNRIGILGFSTGGVVAVGAATRYDEESRPDFAAAAYLAFSASGVTLPPDVPGLFLLAASDDPMAVATSLSLYSAWNDGGHPAELHLYAKGGHGFGMKPQGLPTDQWIARFADWLDALG